MEEISSFDHSVHQLQRQFMRNIANEKSSLTLTKIELSTLPNRKMLKKYESLFSPNGSEAKEIIF